jgi:hypothetical protein
MQGTATVIRPDGVVWNPLLLTWAPPLLENLGKEEALEGNYQSFGSNVCLYLIGRSNWLYWEFLTLIQCGDGFSAASSFACKRCPSREIHLHDFIEK